jgi:hypothetical protein
VTLITSSGYLTEVDYGRYLFLKLLDGHVTLNSSPVEVLTEFPPNDPLPCITMSSGAGLGETGTYIQDFQNPLPSDNPFYDPENPNELYNTQRRYMDTSEENMMLHVWADTQEDRDNIVRQVRQYIRNARLNQYPYCANFNQTTQKCSTTNNECDAITTSNAYSVQGNCPYPNITDPTDSTYRNPTNYFTITGVRTWTIKLHQAENIDQLDILPPVFHSTISIDYTIDEYTTVDVNPFIELTENTD